MSSIIETSPMNTPVHIENDNEEMISIDLSEVERRRELDEEAFRHIIEETRSIADRADKYKNAHTYCKGFNQISDKMVKVSMLVLSTLTTYFISKHTDELTADELFVDKNLTFGTTIVSGINAIFNFSIRLYVFMKSSMDSVGNPTITSTPIHMFGIILFILLIRVP